MGSDDFYGDEKPARTASVGDFWIDEAPVTTAEFARFVTVTSYKTFAEYAPDPSDYPSMPLEMAQPGSVTLRTAGRTYRPKWQRHVVGFCVRRGLASTHWTRGA